MHRQKKIIISQFGGGLMSVVPIAKDAGELYEMAKSDFGNDDKTGTPNHASDEEPAAQLMDADQANRNQLYMSPEQYDKSSTEMSNSGAMAPNEQAQIMTAVASIQKTTGVSPSVLVDVATAIRRKNEAAPIQKTIDALTLLAGYEAKEPGIGVMQLAKEAATGASPEYVAERSQNLSFSLDMIDRTSGHNPVSDGNSDLASTIWSIINPNTPLRVTTETVGYLKNRTMQQNEAATLNMTVLREPWRVSKEEAQAKMTHNLIDKMPGFANNPAMKVIFNLGNDIVTAFSLLETIVKTASGKGSLGPASSANNTAKANTNSVYRMKKVYSKNTVSVENPYGIRIADYASEHAPRVLSPDGTPTLYNSVTNNGFTQPASAANTPPPVHPMGVNLGDDVVGQSAAGVAGKGFQQGQNSYNAFGQAKIKVDNALTQMENSQKNIDAFLENIQSTIGQMNSLAEGNSNNQSLMGLSSAGGMVTPYMNSGTVKQDAAQLQQRVSTMKTFYNQSLNDLKNLTSLSDGTPQTKTAIQDANNIFGKMAIYLKNKELQAQMLNSYSGVYLQIQMIESRKSVAQSHYNSNIQLYGQETGGVGTYTTQEMVQGRDGKPQLQTVQHDPIQEIMECCQQEAAIHLQLRNQYLQAGTQVQDQAYTAWAQQMANAHEVMAQNLTAQQGAVQQSSYGSNSGVMAMSNKKFTRTADKELEDYYNNLYNGSSGSPDYGSALEHPQNYEGVPTAKIHPMSHKKRYKITVKRVMKPH